MNQTTQQGFTLVELSITLVIIGLLIGGILIGQSMIVTTKVQAQVQQIQQFDIAVTNFMTRYTSIPGDSTAMGCNSGSCNNGKIEDWRASVQPQPSMYDFNEETANFWPQLSQSGVLRNSVSYSPTLNGTFSVSSAAPNSPKAVLDVKSGFIAGESNYGPEGYNYGVNQKRWNIYQMADYSQLTGGNIQDSGRLSISAIDAMAIDKKMDDGLAESGMVYAAKVSLGGYGGACFGGAFLNLGGGGTCNNGANYTANKGKDCALGIVILSQQGGLSY